MRALILIPILFLFALPSTVASQQALLKGSIDGVGAEGRFVEVYRNVDVLADAWISVGRGQVESGGSWNIQLTEPAGQPAAAGPSSEFSGMLRLRSGPAYWACWYDGDQAGALFLELKVPTAAAGPLGQRKGVLVATGPGSTGQKMLEEMTQLQSAIADSARIWWELSRSASRLDRTVGDAPKAEPFAELLALDSAFDLRAQNLAERSSSLALRDVLWASRWALRLALNPDARDQLLEAYAASQAPGSADIAAWMRARAVWNLQPEPPLDVRSEWTAARVVRDLASNDDLLFRLAEHLQGDVHDSFSLYDPYGPTVERLIQQMHAHDTLPADLQFFRPNNDVVLSAEIAERVEDAYFEKGHILWLIVDAASQRAYTEVELLCRKIEVAQSEAHAAAPPSPFEIVVLDMGTDWDAFLALQARAIEKVGGLGAMQKLQVSFLYGGAEHRIIDAFQLSALPQVVVTGADRALKSPKQLRHQPLPSQGMRWPPKRP